MLLRLFDKYEEKLWNSIVEQTPFHKLTYKFDESQTNLSNTFYQYIMNN
ncbi:MAG: capsular polysaccharide synthesis protein [Clostridium saudiense]|nr:capsular polysaccharide synthesis protein [Clostridium saudiense]